MCVNAESEQVKYYKAVNHVCNRDGTCVAVVLFGLVLSRSALARDLMMRLNRMRDRVDDYDGRDDDGDDDDGARHACMQGEWARRRAAQLNGLRFECGMRGCKRWSKLSMDIIPFLGG